MAESVVKKEQGTWQSAIIVQESYGVLVAYYNATLKIAVLVWTGNSIAPTAEARDFDLPSYLKPVRNLLTPLRHGDVMEVKGEGKVRIITTTDTWSGGTLTYPLAIIHREMNGNECN